ncbi:MAG: hypothetical protein IJW41_04855 [Oscillospiraceae bacterium]|nr:hypothetical protein [Oscillospiraceae bacterium]
MKSAPCTHCPRAQPAVHKFVEFCFQFRYCLFKTCPYDKNRKAAEAVTVPFFAKTIFYLSSFLFPKGRPHPRVRPSTVTETPEENGNPFSL